MIDALRDVLVPPRCAGCGSGGQWLCARCREGIEPLSRRLPGLRLRAAGAYAGPLRDAIHRLKYRGERGLAHELGGLVAAQLVRDLARGGAHDAVVPVSLHPARAKERGYDQAMLLSEVIADAAGLPLLGALHRVRAGAAQVSLDRAARLRNVAGAFVARAGALAGLRVVLVDDVATTGATLRAAAAAARAAGATAIGAYVVAVDE